MSGSKRKDHPLRTLVATALVTLAGAGMVAGGIVGIVNDARHDGAKSSSASLPPVSVTPGGVNVSDITQAGSCQVNDPRLDSSRQIFLQPPHGPGSATATVSCLGGVVSVAVELKGAGSKDVFTYEVWLYRSKRRATQIGTLFAHDGDAFGTATITSDIDTNKYTSLVLVPRTLQDAGSGKPDKIAFAAVL
ncbi:MAG: hypothetical protein QOJ07_3085 [Thermoleophilaceae bacterium]|nr:hypothetical protein [Thermoleophilaceae bacterium]